MCLCAKISVGCFHGLPFCDSGDHGGSRCVLAHREQILRCFWLRRGDGRGQMAVERARLRRIEARDIVRSPNAQDV